MPIGQIEPLNQWQKQAVQMAAAGPQDNTFLNGAKDYFKQAGQMYTQAGQPMSDADFNALYARFSNPYMRDVIDATTSDINRQRDEALSANRGRMAAQGGDSFGSSAQGVQEGTITTGFGNTLAQQIANLRSNGFNSAVSGALSQAGMDSNNRFNAASGIGGLANTGFAGQQAVQSNFGSNLNNLFNAGGVVQNQNQNLLDVVRAEMDKQRGYPTQNLQTIASLLGLFNGGQSSASNGGSGLLNGVSGAGLTLASGFKNGQFNVSNIFK
jgi:hypothetical protein